MHNKAHTVRTTNTIHTYVNMSTKNQLTLHTKITMLFFNFVLSALLTAQKSFYTCAEVHGVSGEANRIITL